MSDRQSLSKSHLLVFALVFGLIGIIIWKSMAAPNPNLQGDLNGDNTVDASDLSILLSDFGTTNSAADINGDGTVDVEDLSILLSYYGQSYTPPAATAHIWVATDGADICTRNASAVSLNDARTDGNVCATFNRAYDEARQSDNVYVAGGIYPTQTITYDATKTSANGQCRVAFDSAYQASEDDSGCVTFQPNPGDSVMIGGKTQTSAYTDASTGTIPVNSTVGWPIVPGQTYYRVYLNNGGGSGFNCVGKDNTDFTGCTPAAFTCDTTGAGNQTACLFEAGDSAMYGGLTVSGASYLRFLNMQAGFNITVDHDASSHNASDVIFDDVTTSGGFIRGSYVTFENGLSGDVNAADNFKWSNCDHCAIYHNIARNSTDEGLDPKMVSKYGHNEAYYLNNDTNQYIVGNAVYGSGGSANIFFSYGSSSNPGPVYIINNYIGEPEATVSVDLHIQDGQTYDSYVIEGNSSTNTWGIGSQGTTGGNQFTNWQVSGNLGIGVPCSGGSLFSTYDVQMHYNVDSGTACSNGTTETNNTGGVSLSSIWTDAADGNLDLTGGSYAWEDTWAACPLALDIHGTARPSSCTPGADQR